jgi:uncharacterized membrane protein YphA (DoxX/SURF4 family)
VSVDPVIVTIARLLLASLFASAAWHKLADLTAFRIVLHDYRVLPPVLVTPATAVVVTTEIALCAGFAHPASAPLAAWVAVVLLASYGVAIAVNLVRGRRTLECGCAPSAYRQPLSEWLLLRNAALIGVCCLSLARSDARPFVAVDWWTVAGAVVAGAMVWSAATRLLAVASFERAIRGVPR